MESRTNRRDLAVAIGKGALGAIPIVGPLAAEVVGTLIPNQRVERIEKLLTVLESKISDLDAAKLKSRFSEPEFVDLFEDGMYQSARAMSQNRLEHIAALMKNGLEAENEKALQYKMLLAHLGELNDVEVILLRSYAKHPARDQEFRERHEQILEPRRAHQGSSQEELDEAIVYEGYRNHLVRLGFLRNRYKKPKRGELPEMDEKTGMIKASGREITPFGRLLLRSIDLIADDEF